MSEEKSYLESFGDQVKTFAEEFKISSPTDPRFERLKNMYPNAEKHILSFFSYLQSNSGLFKSDKKELLGCLVKSLKADLPIDGENVHIIYFGAKPTFCISYKGLINAVTRHISDYSVIHARPLTHKALEICADELKRMPKNNEALPVAYHMENELVTLDNTVTVSVSLSIDKGYVHEEYYSKADLLARLDTKQLSRGVWSSNVRETDSLEMLKKTAIRLFCKTLPNMPQYVQELI